MKNRFSKIHMLSFRICVVQMCTVCTAFTHFISAVLFFFLNVLHFSFYISFPGVFTLFLYFGTKIHTNNTLIL